MGVGAGASPRDNGSIKVDVVSNDGSRILCETAEVGEDDRQRATDLMGELLGDPVVLNGFGLEGYAGTGFDDSGHVDNDAA